MLLDTVRKTISEYGMLEKGDKVLCAVSGGADSICLLNVLLALKDEYNISLYVANVNHLIRGDEAKRDSDFVKEICRREQIECFYREYDVPAISRERKMGEEECGRILRYEFFNEISEKLFGVKIATAHNLNDNAETILFRLARGSSASGLCGIKHVRGNIIRPLLDVTREEIEDYLKEHNLSWCEDSTNKLTYYNRNKLRHCVMPLLEEVSNGAQKKIVSAAKLLREDDMYLSQSAVEVMKKCFFGDYLLTTPLKETHIAIKRRVIATILEKWGAKEITVDKIDDFTLFLSKESGKSFDINSAYFAEKSYDKIYLVKRKKEEKRTQVLDVDKECSGENWSLKVTISETPIKKNSNNIAIFDAKKLSLPLTVRYRQAGDKLSQSGMQGTKKVSDIFTDEKVEKHLRDLVPIVEKDGEILFVCGLRKSSLYGVGENTKKYLIIQYEKLTERRRTNDGKY